MARRKESDVKYTDLVADVTDLYVRYDTPEAICHQAREAWLAEFKASSLASMFWRAVQHRRARGEYVLGWFVGSEDGHHYCVVLFLDDHRVVVEDKGPTERVQRKD